MPSLRSLVPFKSRLSRKRQSWSSLPEATSDSLSAPIPAWLPARYKSPTPTNSHPNSPSTLIASPLPSPALSATSAPPNPFDDHFCVDKGDQRDIFEPRHNVQSTDRSHGMPHGLSASKVSDDYQPYPISKNLSLAAGVPVASQKSWMRCSVSACKNKFNKHLDLKTIWSIFDIREIFWPFSWRKYAVLLGVAMLIAVIVVTEVLFHWIQKSMAITRKNMLPVLVIVIALEPVMMVIILLVAKIPDNAPEDTLPASEQDLSALEKRVNHVENTNRTALVIPCHNSEHAAMTRVLESAYPHFRPQDIFIIDNGRTPHPTSNEFRKFIHGQHADINYIWSPIGSKNAAQLVGAMAARDYEYIMTVDDDVCIPGNFRAPLDLVDERTKGVAFPLKATDASGKVALFMVAWQDCEYRMAGLTKLAESQICGALFPHGAGWFCERATLIDLITNYHSIDFIAEDVNTGLSMQKMKKLIAFDARCILETEVPTTIFGQGLNWYKQRVRSWEMGRHGRLLAFADRLLFSLNGQRTPWGIFAQKFIHLYSIAGIIVDWVRIPVLITMGGNRHYWRQAGLLTLASILPLMWFKFVSCRRRKDLQPTFWGSVTIPIYKQLYSLVSIIGAIRAVVFYLGGHKLPKTVREMVKEGDKRAFWLDPRFETNPGFLADEDVLKVTAAQVDVIKDTDGVKSDELPEVSVTEYVPPLRWPPRRRRCTLQWTASGVSTA